MPEQGRQRCEIKFCSGRYYWPSVGPKSCSNGFFDGSILCEWIEGGFSLSQVVIPVASQVVIPVAIVDGTADGLDVDNVLCNNGQAEVLDVIVFLGVNVEKRMETLDHRWVVLVVAHIWAGHRAFCHHAHVVGVRCPSRCRHGVEAHKTVPHRETLF